jgi:hypothetical protein
MLFTDWCRTKNRLPTFKPYFQTSAVQRTSMLQLRRRQTDTHAQLS